MNFKKFISGVSALTIAASAFAGMAVTANATSTLIYSNDFETSSDFIARDTSSQIWNPSYSTLKESKVIGIGGGTGDSALISPTLTALDAYDSAEAVSVSFDFKIDACYTSKSSNIYLMGNAPTGKYLASSDKQILTITAACGGTAGKFDSIKVNGTNVTEAIREAGTDSNHYVTYEFAGLGNVGLNRQSTGWVTLNAVVNFNTKKVTYTMSKGGVTVVNETTVDFVNTSSTELQTIFVNAGKTYGGAFLDNVVVNRIDPPKMTVADTATVSTNGVETLDVTDITGAVSSTVTSSDSSIVTGSYENGVLTINGGETAGIATLTLTAENDGAKITKTVTVTVGAVATADVTTNHYVVGTTDAVPTKTSTTANYHAVELADIDTATVAQSDARYVYDHTEVNGEAVTFPYTVPSSDPVTMNVYYTKQDAVTKLTVNYTDGTNVIDSKDYTLSGKYVGDTYEYYIPAYIDDNDNSKLYEYSSLPTVTSGSYVGSDWSYFKQTLSTADTTTVSHTYTDVTANYDGYQYHENDSWGAGTASRASNGRIENDGSTLREAGYDLFTVAESGKYTLRVVAAMRAWNGNKDVTVKVNGTAIGDTYNLSSTTSTPYVYTDLNLKAGDVITMVSTGAAVGVDYALLVKTDDLATVSEVSYEQFDAEETTSATDKSITAAKIYVTVSSTSIDKLGLKYGDVTEYADDITKITADGETGIVLGAIVPGLVTLTTDSFKAVVD